jgi:LAS superfamily LD-carboxypeptidase LdcB
MTPGLSEHNKGHAFDFGHPCPDLPLIDRHDQPNNFGLAFSAFWHYNS